MIDKSETGSASTDDIQDERAHDPVDGGSHSDVEAGTRDQIAHDTNNRKTVERQGAQIHPENGRFTGANTCFSSLFGRSHRWLRTGHVLARSLGPHGPPPFL